MTRAGTQHRRGNLGKHRRTQRLARYLIRKFMWKGVESSGQAGCWSGEGRGIAGFGLASRDCSSIAEAPLHKLDKANWYKANARVSNSILVEFDCRTDMKSRNNEVCKAQAPNERFPSRPIPPPMQNQRFHARSSRL
jgi:hypothetical protein